MDETNNVVAKSMPCMLKQLLTSRKPASTNRARAFNPLPTALCLSLNDHLHLYANLNPSHAMTSTTPKKRPHSPSSTLLHIQEIYRSSTITENHSTFTAAFSPSLTANDLQRLSDFQSATHRIAAWRKRSKQTTLKSTFQTSSSTSSIGKTGKSEVIYVTGHDDDGESWAGSKLERVLKMALKEGEEGAVVVARWYGGVNIGPIRFTHIENCAKEAIWSWRNSSPSSQNMPSTAHQQNHVDKKQKVDSEAERKELAESLAERDQNILTLRRLLAEKNAKLKDEDIMPPTPQKAPPDYGKMALEALKRVDRARDATVAFILKQIDKVDEELKMLEGIGDFEDVEETDIGPSMRNEIKDAVEHQDVDAVEVSSRTQQRSKTTRPMTQENKPGQS